MCVRLVPGNPAIESTTCFTFLPWSTASLSLVKKITLSLHLSVSPDPLRPHPIPQRPSVIGFVIRTDGGFAVFVYQCWERSFSAAKLPRYSFGSGASGCKVQQLVC